jgi:hypothetical protein
LFTTDVERLLHCSRSKARLLIHEVGPHYAGRTPFVTTDDIERYLTAHDGRIVVHWPKRPVSNNKTNER